MAFPERTPRTDRGIAAAQAAQAAPDYAPAAWPEPVALLPRRPLDPLGTVLIPAPERQLYTRSRSAQPPPAAPAQPTPAQPVPVSPLPPVPPVPPVSPVSSVPAGPAARAGFPPAAAVPDASAAHRAPTGPRGLRLALRGGGQARRRQLLDRIRVPLRVCHRIAVLGSPAGGVTTVLGALLAEHRADPVLVLVPGGPYQGERRTAGRLVVQSVPADPAALPATLAELSGHYPVILTDTTASPVDLRPPAVELADQLVVCEPASAGGAGNAASLLDHLTALGRHGLAGGAATVFTSAPPTDRPLAERDLAAYFRTRCRGAVVLPPHTPADPATLRPRIRTGYLELAALVGDAMADRRG
ncbi:hypothetical protein [Kitasatospora sp. NPDC086791]|uniref:hypothetical protein n=1 Tax=Kitasatospora sp. NPDC086791 TaxID=3155178 RepID=UPI003418DD24